MQDIILYGEDQEKNIVSISPVSGQNIVQIFKRVNGRLESRYEPYNYLVYINEKDPLLKKYNVDQVKLKGSNHYNVLVKTKDQGIYLDFKHKSKDCYVPFEKSQYMVQSGKTCFKGMDFNDPLTLFFDLEVLTSEGYDFPNASRPKDQIIIITIKTNQGFEKVLRIDDYSSYSQGFGEANLIKHFIAVVRKIDPDVIANHNIFGFDLSYLKDRCELLGIPLALGRNGSEPNVYTTSIKFADRSREYPNFDIYGRTVIDTQFLAEYADITNRNMPSYSLKDLVRYLGKAQKDRTYIKGDDIAPIWREQHPFYNREDLVKYAIEDVREAEVLYKEYGEVFFALTQMVPMNYQEVFRYGTGNQVEYIFLREYFRQEWSYPKNTEQGKVPGGYADVLNWGIFKEDIVYIDVKSLYPSLASILNIQPRKDELKIFQHILKVLTDLKYSINKEENKALYNLVKIFLNTMSYGFIASPWNSFSDYEEASKITLGGQEKAKDLIKIIQNDKGMVIRWDTDGGVIILPKGYKPDQYCERLTDKMPEGIIVENDGVYDGIIPFDGKGYALLEKDRTIKIKGASLIGRSLENFGTQFIKDCIEALFYYDFDEAKEICQELYKDYQEAIQNRNLEAQDVAKRSNLNMTLNEYLKRKEGNTPTITQYELALKANREYKKGDVISYYIKEYPYEYVELRGKPTIRKKKCANYEAAELLENYTYDIEISFYLNRLDEMAKRFMVLGESLYNDLFDINVYAKDKKRFKKITGLNWK